MNVSIIIPVLDDPRLRQCLEALHSQIPPAGPDVEILVVDNGPTDRIRSIASQFPVSYLIETRRGCEVARNRGVAAARGSLLIFTDADCVQPPEWLQTIRLAFRDPTLTIALGPSRCFDEARVARWVQSVDDALWAELARRPTVAYCDTRNLAVRRQVVETERFDGSLRRAGDIEFGWRVAQRGFRIRLVPEMWLWHRNPTSLLRLLRRSFRRGRGVQRVHNKHGESLSISAARTLRVLGKDLKPAVVRWTTRGPLRWPSAVLLCGLLGTLTGYLFLLLCLPVAEDRGKTPFRWMDRASILLGRIVG